MWRWGFMCDVRVSGVFAVRCGVWGAGVWGVGVRYGGRHRGEVWGCESVRCVCCGDVVCEMQGYEVWGWSMEVGTGVRCGGVRCEGGVLCVMWECQVCLLWGRGVWGAGVWGVGVRYGGRHRSEVWGCDMWRWGFMCDVRVSGVFAVRCGVWGAGVWGVGVRYGGRHRGEVWGCESVRCVCCGDVVCEMQGYEVWGWSMEVGTGVRCGGVRCEDEVLCVMWECQVCFLRGRDVWGVMCRRLRCRGMRYTRGKVQGWGVGVWDVKVGFYVWCESVRCVCCEVWCVRCRGMRCGGEVWR